MHMAPISKFGVMAVVAVNAAVAPSAAFGNSRTVGKEGPPLNPSRILQAAEEAEGQR